MAPEWLEQAMDDATLLAIRDQERAGLVDELFVTMVPRVLGGALAPTLAQGPGFAADEIPDAILGSIDRVGDELFLRYDFRWR